jgi:hypothetical protein
VSIQDDIDELSEFQKSLKYKIVKVGDIVEEAHWISVNPSELLTGIVIKVEKARFDKIQWFNFADDEITIKWFRSGEVERLPSCYIKIISNISES